MGIWLMTAAANLVVGALVGLCGVAGFLLPMFYTAGLGMSVTEGLALSFAAFIISGALDSWNYKKAGNLDVKFGLKLSIGSLIGAILGVKLNLIIPEEQVKVILYLVVLLSGISILVRKDGKPEDKKKKGFSIERNLPVTLLLGAVTGYLAQCDIKKLLPVLLIALLTHVVGVYFGSKNASRINQKLLKTGIAVFSVGIAVCKLTGIF